MMNFTFDTQLTATNITATATRNLIFSALSEHFVPLLTAFKELELYYPCANLDKLCAFAILSEVSSLNIQYIL